jgi:uncharacterized coiled-coil protein SlyX
VEERLIELEVRVAFQERLIAELDEVVRSLRTQVDRLEADLALGLPALREWAEAAQLAEHPHVGSDEP